MRLKQYDTSVLATYSNGKTKKFSSLEEAAKETKLTERTIKSRAVNQGKTGKDGITFEWINQKTKKAFKAKQSKAKGNSWELDIINKLKSIGYQFCVSSRSESKRLDDAKVDIADPSGELPCYIQAKFLATTPNYHKISEECTKKDKPFVIAWKKAHNDGSRPEEPIAMIPLSFFYELIKK